MFFSGDFVYDEQDFLAYLGDMCLSVEKPLCVVGYDKEVQKVEEVVSKSFIKREFIRPLDVKSLASELQELIDAELQAVIDANGKQNAEKHILLVDDDATFLQMMQSWLGTNYKVAAARSGG